MEKIGEKIKNVRLAKGLSLEDVHNKTKIHLNVLKAIEEDSLVNFSPVYIKGFLKIYCKFLGLNLNEFVPDYKEAHTPENTVTATSGASFGFGFLKAILKNLKVIVVVILIIVAAAALFKAAKFAIGKLSLLFHRPQVSLSREPKNTQLRKAQKVKAASSSGVRLSIHAKEDCWVQVKRDGRIVFQYILKRGRSDSWMAKEKIEFSLSNAAAAEVLVNNNPIPQLGRRGQAIKNALITKEGLITSR